MSLDRQAVSQLLPCFVCGDLPPDLIEQVQRALEADPELAAQARALREAEAACRELLADPDAPGRSFFSASPLAPQGFGRALLVAASAVLLAALGASLHAAAQPPLGGLVEVHLQTSGSGALGFIAQEDPARLAASLRQAGVPTDLLMIADLRAEGLRLVGGQPAPSGLGALILYEKDGVHYLCQVYRALPAMPPRELQQVGATTLRSYQHGSVGLVRFEGPGVVCVFSAALPAEEIAALVARRLRALG